MKAAKLKERIEEAKTKEQHWVLRQEKLHALQAALPYIQYFPGLDLDGLIALLEVLSGDEELVHALQELKLSGCSIFISADSVSRHHPIINERGELEIPYGLPIGGDLMREYLRDFFGLTRPKE